MKSRKNNAALVKTNQAAPQEALIYCRVSSAKQVTEGNGLESQEIACIKYCAENGYNVVRVFKDAAVSGGARDRAALDAMLQFIVKSRKKYIVVANEMSRIARDLEIGIELFALMKKLNCEIQTVNHELSEDPAGKLVRNVQLAVGQFEKDTNRERVISRMDAQQSLGRRMYGTPFMWYKPENKTIVPFQPNADIMKDVYKGLASGELSKNRRVLCDFMTQKGFTNRKGEPTPPTRHVLTSLITENAIMESAGFVKYREEWIVAQHQPIISHDLAKRVLAKVNEREGGIYRQGLSELFPLRGLIFCEGCGAKMTASSPNKGTYSYYYCTMGGCKHRHVNTSAELVHQHFVALLQRVTPSDEILRVTAELLKKEWKEDLLRMAEERRRWQNRLTDLRERMRDFLLQASGAPSEVVKKALYEEVERLGTEKEKLEQLMNDQGYGENDFEKGLEVVYGLVRNPCTAWIEGELAHKRMIQRLIFANGIHYEPKIGFRKPDYALPFRLFEVLDGGNENLVDPNGTTLSKRVRS